MLSSFIATLIRATRDELIAAGESLENATELADGSGFLASLGVYHEMHCLVRSRFPPKVEAHDRDPPLLTADEFRDV